MRRNPERLAWVVTLSSFAICCVLSSLTTLGMRWFLLNSTNDLALGLTSSDTVLVHRPGAGEAVVNPSTLPVGSIIVTNEQSQAGLTFTTPDGREAVAYVQVYGNSRLTISLANTPRYSISPHPTRIRINLTSGRLRIQSAATASRIYLEVLSPPQTATTLNLPNSNVSIDATVAQTGVTVRQGEADVAVSGRAIHLLADQRAEVTADMQLAGPLLAERNLVVNGNFQTTLENGWVADIRPPADPAESPGTLSIIANAGRRVVKFSRAGQNWGQVGIVQQINQDVRDLKSLRLRLDVYLTYQDIFNCGVLGTECPLMVQIKYIDNGGGEREWVQGYFYNYSPVLGPTLCASCSEPRGEHRRLTAQRWQTIESDDLLDIFRRAGAPAVTIRSIAVYASGHSFESMAGEIQLLAAD